MDTSIGLQVATALIQYWLPLIVIVAVLLWLKGAIFD